MTLRHLICVSSVCFLLSLTISPATLSAGDEKDRINVFYQKLVQTLKDPQSNARQLVELVRENRVLAEKCLSIIKEKSAGKEPEGQGFQILESKLEESLWLTSTRPDCSQQGLEKLLAAAKKLVGDDDKLLYLETIAKQCPQDSQAFHLLGDAYFKRGQTGMAVEAYRSALKLGDDEESRTLLARAEEMMKEYERGKPLTADDVRSLFKAKLMAPIPGLKVRKVEVRSTLQTNKILFDEWSYQIKESAKPLLQAVGEVAAQEFKQNNRVGLLVEGHTDKRGPIEKNVRLSVARADAIKKYLVDTFHIDPNRLVTKGYGPSRPFSALETDSGYELNRRVEFKKIDLPAGN